MRESIIQEPETTPSILANIPDSLRSVLRDSIEKVPKGRKSVLISSNSFANRFILERWGIRPSQRRRYRNLYTTIRKQCRSIFQQYLTQERMDWTSDSESFIFGVYKYDEIRGNLILGFVRVSPESEWVLRQRE